MVALRWSEQLEVGVEKFDNQHKKLVDLLNEFYAAMQEKKDKEILIKIVRSLIDYTIVHFQDEEKVLIINKYPDYAAHKREHENLKMEVNSFMKKYRKNDMTSSDLLNFLKDWIVNHLQVSDKKYKPYIKKIF
jgi:hemerythrin